MWQFPSDPYDVILCILQLAVIVGLLLTPMLHFKVLAAGLFILLLPHWTVKRSWLWWTLVGLGTAVALSSLILALHR